MPDPSGPPPRDVDPPALHPPDLQPNDALFLDIDGTLLDIAPHPDEVVVPEGLPGLLVELRARLKGALAILSGRDIDTVDLLLAPARLACAGEHGAVIRTTPGGAPERLSRPLPDSLADAVRLCALDFPAVEIERKSSAIAAHFRNAPDAELLLAARLADILSRHPGWTMMRGRRVFDIVALHVRKGATLDMLCDLPPFRGRRPIVIGDDVTDLSAFEAAAARGGRGLSVASNLFSPSEADFQDPTAVRAWLRRMSDRLSCAPLPILGSPHRRWNGDTR